MEKLQINLNPDSLSSYVGNESIKKIIRITIDACKDNHLLLSHTLISGPRGVGKTALARIIPIELGLTYKILSANALGTVADMNNLFVFDLPDILILDEIHNLKHYLSDLMHSAMDNFEYSYLDEENNIIRVQTKPFSLIGMTTDSGKLTAPLYSRFQKKFNLRPYTDSNLQTIVMNVCKNNNIEIDSLAASEIAFRSNGIPRIALLNMINIYEYAIKYNNKKIDHKTACDALDLHGIDEKGLDPIQRDILMVLSNSEKPIGSKNLSSRVGIGEEALLNIHEDYLLRAGLVERRSTGRVITLEGKNHILKFKS